MIVNGIPSGETLANFIASEGIVALEITPLRDEMSVPDQGTCFIMCDPEDADMWSIYGRKKDGMAILIHDLGDEPGPEIQWLHDVTRLPVAMFNTKRCSGPMATTKNLAEWLTEIIHDDIPSVEDAANFRDDDFDNHPLAPLRESLCAACGYTGEPIVHPEGAST